MVQQNKWESAVNEIYLRFLMIEHHLECIFKAITWSDHKRKKKKGQLRNGDNSLTLLLKKK